jgi:hypothetical protein
MPQPAARSRATPSTGFRIPLLNIELNKPSRGSLAWYAGLGAMSALEVIEWPVAILVAVSHALATHSHNPDVRETAEGAQASV